MDLQGSILRVRCTGTVAFSSATPSPRVLPKSRGGRLQSYASACVYSTYMYICKLQHYPFPTRGGGWKGGRIPVFACLPCICMYICTYAPLPLQWFHLISLGSSRRGKKGWQGVRPSPPPLLILRLGPSRNLTKPLANLRSGE